MKIKETSTKMADDFRDFSKRAAINHAFTKKLLKQLTMPEMQVRIVRYFKLNNPRYLELINMEEENA